MLDSHPPTAPLDLQLLQTGKHLMILDSDSEQPAGVLLCRRFTADLILAGSLMGGSTDARGFERAIPLGSVRLTVPADQPSRQIGLEQRMQSLQHQQQVIGEPNPLERAQKLLELLYSIFDRGLINSLADGDLAKAAGVLTGTMTLAKQQVHRGRQVAAA